MTENVTLDDTDKTFVIKDSGKRMQFDSGMVRDTSTGKVEYDRVICDGPLFHRWAAHVTKATIKYPDDPETGEPNWKKANSPKEQRRFKRSACRHFVQWALGFRDEDHAAATAFNINGAEYVRDQLAAVTT